MKKFLKLFVKVMLICTIIILTLGFLTPSFALKAMEVPEITYQAYVEDKKWLEIVSNGEIAGTTGQSKRLEALIINLKENENSMIKYRAHVAEIGWQTWVTSGIQAGTTGKSSAIEAVQVELTDEYIDKYDIYYRVHVPSKGWLGWAKNGETAGSVGISLRTEAFQIRLVTKGSEFLTGGKSSLTKPILNYSAHVQNIGWMNYVGEGTTAGTTGQSKRMEAIRINLSDFEGNNGILYRAHVSDIGWQNWVSSSQVSGTEGQDRAIEAVEIKLSPTLSEFFDIYYRGGPAYKKITPTIRSRIVDAAYSRLGCPYVWGGNGPNSFDCSGLVKWCYAQVGISIPRTSGDQGNCGTKISVSQAQPGDILWKSGHVGIYIGNGQYIHAPHSGEVVKISSVSSGKFTHAVRVV